jgi:hypothetical protein
MNTRFVRFTQGPPHGGYENSGPDPELAAARILAGQTSIEAARNPNAETDAAAARACEALRKIERQRGIL